MKLLRSGFFISGLFFLAGAAFLAALVKYPPSGVLSNIFFILCCLACFLMVPRGSWLARQLRYRDYVAANGPFETAQGAWEAFEAQDASPSAEDPMFLLWNKLADARLAEAKKEKSEASEEEKKDDPHAA